LFWSIGSSGMYYFTEELVGEGIAEIKMIKTIEK
jgi:hypothetical protein